MFQHRKTNLNTLYSSVRSIFDALNEMATLEIPDVGDNEELKPIVEYLQEQQDVIASLPSPADPGDIDSYIEDMAKEAERLGMVYGHNVDISQSDLGVEVSAE